MVKPPFSERHDPERGEGFSSLHEGVPDFLVRSLLDWALGHFIRNMSGKRTIDRQMVLRLERRARRDLPLAALNDSKVLARAFREDDALFLDAIDFVLSQKNYYDFSNNNPQELDGILEEAGSAYCVGTDEDDNFELQFRQVEQITELLHSEVDQPDRATDHLHRAWSKCFRRDADPNDAYGEAVKAIEVAAKPVVTPDDPLATLGKMISAIRDEPGKWETDSESDGGVQTILAMMNLAWKGQLRHGDESAPLDVSQDAAEMTVQTAVLLVSWFRSGQIRLMQQR